jgi:hypothetical protein
MDDDDSDVDHKALAKAYKHSFKDKEGKINSVW